MGEKFKLNPKLIPLKNKINFSWAKDLNAKDKTTKLLKDIIEDYLYEFACCREGFLKSDTIIQNLNNLTMLKLITSIHQNALERE